MNVKNIYPGMFQGIDMYMNVTGSLQSFLVEQKLTIIKQQPDGHCFINCLKQFFCERFGLFISLEEMGNRFKYYMLKDIKYLMSFIPDVESEYDAIKNITEMHKTLFENKIFSHGFTDMLINTCSRYFSFKLLIVEERDRFNTHLIPILNTEPIEFDHEYQQYCGELIVVLRSGRYDEGNIFSSHYDLLLPIDMPAKYKIGKNGDTNKINSNSGIKIVKNKK